MCIGCTIFLAVELVTHGFAGMKFIATVNVIFFANLVQKCVLSLLCFNNGWGDIFVLTLIHLLRCAVGPKRQRLSI